eukprot:3611804-Prymnesium_polylepis.1
MYSNVQRKARSLSPPRGAPRGRRHASLRPLCEVSAGFSLSSHRARQSPCRAFERCDGSGQREPGARARARLPAIAPLRPSCGVDRGAARLDGRGGPVAAEPSGGGRLSLLRRARPA